MQTQEQAREAALAACLAAIEKTHGKGAIMRYDETPEMVPSTPSGSLGLDLALGCGGYPRGRIIEIYGPEASGKTTLTLHALAEMQRLGGTTAFVDAEHALDPTYAKAIGVRVEKMIVSQPDSAEQAIDIVEALVRSNAVDLIVVDSVAALVPKEEIEGSMEDQQMGLHARIMTKAVRKLAGIISKSNATLIFINQLRQKIGVTFGPTETTTGGNGLKYFASVRLDVRRATTLKGKDDVPFGARTRVKVVKNKLAPPFRQVEFDIHFGKGIHHCGEVIDLAEEQGTVSKAGAWYSLGDTRLGQGRDNAIAHLEAHPALMAQIQASLRSDRLPIGMAEA
jgi:recombination protein RecA